MQPAGALADAVDARLVLAGALVISAAGLVSLPLADSAWPAIALVAVVGVGESGFRTGQSTLIASLASGVTRAAAFAMQRLVRNVGIGLGAAAAGLLVSGGDFSRFTIIFVADGVCTLLFAAAALSLPSVRQQRASDRSRGGYRGVLRDRLAMTVFALNVVFVAAGYAQFQLLPAYARNDVHLAGAAIGVAFLINTLVITVAQLPIIRTIGKRRLRGLALMGLLWAIGWIFVFFAGVSGSGQLGLALIFAGVAIFGLGECFHPAQTALVADLAPDTLRGRYMALTTTSFQVGLLIGPAVGGFVLDRAPLALWPAAALVALIGGAAALALEGSYG